MKVFLIQLKNPNHPTGSYRRDGWVFKTNQKVYAEAVSKIIAEDKNLKVSEAEAPKDAKPMKTLGSTPFIKPSPEKEKKEPEKENKE